MAITGRAFPIKPHLARPLVAQSVVRSSARIVSPKQALPRLIPRPHLASAVVARSVVGTSAKIVSLKQFPRQFIKAHIAGPVLTSPPPPPLVTRAYMVVAKVGISSRKGYVKLAPYIKGAPPAPPLWTKAYVVKRWDQRRPISTIKLARSIVGPFVPISLLGGWTTAAQATTSGAVTGMAVCSGAIAAQATCLGSAVTGQSL